MQFHVEVEEDTIDNWAEIPEYFDALRNAMGDDGTEKLRKKCLQEMKSFNDMAERLYINWLQTSAKT